MMFFMPHETVKVPLEKFKGQEVPANCVFHINGDNSDFRKANLRVYKYPFQKIFAEDYHNNHGRYQLSADGDSYKRMVMKILGIRGDKN